VLSGAPAGTVADGVLGGRYQLGEELGRGGMAVVHRATDLVLGREVAVKLFRSDVAVAADPQRIRSEIRILASVNHPALVTLHDASAGGPGEPAYLVMELVDGQDLGHLLPGFPARDLLTVASQVAGGLAHIHEQGIVHRDVKPANVLISRRGQTVRAKLGDLGIARLVDGTRMTAVGTLIGTAAYLSPEQVLGESPSPASDVYALGLLVLEGLTGEHPFTGTRAESLTARTSRPPHLPEGLTPEDAALLSSMTAVDPAQRMPAAAAEIALAAWSSEGPFSIPAALQETRAAATPTLVLPARGGGERAAEIGTAPMQASAVTGGTVAASRPGRPASAARSTGTEETAELRTRPHASRRALVATLAVLAVVAAGISGILLVRPGAQAAPAPEPTYPAVDGPLGDHLEQLQDSVVPG
jgi:tRNA A-37 threonylcarbamoyl transferase component Bud32